jgi:hypothetical protein
MISNVRGLRRDAERVKGVRVHNCVKFGCSDDYRVKWDGMRPQCSTWESEFYVTKCIDQSLVKYFG